MRSRSVARAEEERLAAVSELLAPMALPAGAAAAAQVPQADHRPPAKLAAVQGRMVPQATVGMGVTEIALPRSVFPVVAVAVEEAGLLSPAVW